MKMLEKSILLFSLLLEIVLIHGSDHVERMPYIIYMGDVPKMRPSMSSMMEIHHRLISAVIGDEEVARQSIIHSYGKSFNALAARMLPDEAKKLSEMEGVVSVFQSTRRTLHTTRSWNFLEFPTTVERKVGRESNMIIGLLDTGIWPTAPSFNDKGFGPPPSKWKGNCEKVGNFSGCNKKIIGAKYYRLESSPPIIDILSPVDRMGHGTHTSSIAAGNAITGASLYGIANGTARGGVPSARIAMYKVCWFGEGCSDIDLLAGFDDAIADGVDIVSVSIGGVTVDYFSDTIAIGAFHAMRKGILTSCSAGNGGPQAESIVNTAPWILTVAASGVDPQFRTKIRLGNGKKLSGISINTFSPKKQVYPLISGANAANTSSTSYGEPSACDTGTLDSNKVRGKVVYCIEGMGRQDESVKASGGVGALIRNDQFMDTAFSFVLPAAYITTPVADIISNYINTTKHPQAVIYKSRDVHVTAPFVGSFSSRGPDPLSMKILKPDVTAPGVDILAGYSRLTTVTGSFMDDRVVNFNIVSGTSMACPHVAATAAYVKSFHPDWSPAAIKSAIITTAKSMSSKKNMDAEFAYGSGHIQPARAVHPGLIYDANEISYIQFLCKDGYNGSMLQIILGNNAIDCSDVRVPPGYDGLNYPTMQYKVPSARHKVSAAFRRTVTNVGHKKSIYKVTVRAPKELSVMVKPDTLKFKRLHQKKSFRVLLKGSPLGKKMLRSAEIVWTDSKHSVRSPIVVYQSFF
ncbi:subtilisin-like protease SBT4.14 [Magnolia sinica]|uniref:subtilisin-like protease SBT4.14 n=1 Tax=Magnolia sinica TaxID=86752 RepID=UPI0026583EF6|nr:subtilisin-like protease SBT4.14 [Magnolia sinica]